MFEVCNPGRAARVMSVEMHLNMALPCRISLYTENGTVKIGYSKMVEMPSGLSKDPALIRIDKDVESSMINIVNAAK